MIKENSKKKERLGKRQKELLEKMEKGAILCFSSAFVYSNKPWLRLPHGTVTEIVDYSVANSLRDRHLIVQIGKEGKFITLYGLKK